MTRDPVTVNCDLTLGQALQLMVRHGIKHLPILKDGRPHAMLNGRDVLRELLRQHSSESFRTLANQPVLDFCGPVEAISAQEDSQRTLQRFEQGHNCLPVVENQRLLGVVSEGNLLRFLAAELNQSPIQGHRKVQNTRLDVLLDVYREISTSQDQEKILEVVCRQLLAVMPVQRAALLLLPSQQSRAYVVNVHSVSGTWESLQPMVPLKDTFCGWIGRQQTSLRSVDLSLEERLDPERESWTEGRGSALSVALFDRAESFGVLQVWTETPNSYHDSDLELLELVGAQVGNFVLHGRRLEMESRLVEQLRVQDRIKDEFLAVVTHDLRNAIQGSLSYTQILLKKSQDPITQKIAKLLEETTQYMASLTGDLHDFGRLGLEALKLDLEVVDLVGQLKRTVNEFEEVARNKTITLRLGTLPGELLLKADPLRLRQILANLISNAIKYNREDGWVEVRLATSGDYVAVEVEDSGIGIEPFEQSRIFELFHQVAVTKKVEGSGLGLTITRRLVELHDGKLELKSQPGVGSTFTVKLPKAGPRTG